MLSSNKKKNWFNILQMFGDVCLFNTAIILAFMYRFGGELPPINFKPYISIMPYITLFALIIFNFYGLYNTINRLWSEVFASLLISNVIITVASVVMSYMTKAYSFPRSVFLLSFVLQIILLGVWRWFAMKLERRIITPKKVIIVAPNGETRVLAEKMKAQYGYYQIMGFISDDENKLISGCTNLGTYDKLEEVCRENTGCVLFISCKAPEQIKNDALHLAFKYDCSVMVVPGIYEIMLWNSKTDQIQDTLVFELGTGNNNHDETKRWVDFVLSLIGLIVTSPIMLLTALAVRLDSPGTILFRQERVTKRGKHFMLYKFRTMVNDAERKTGPVLSGKKDPRITRIGRFLRATRLDELPQLLNVLKGEMSIVGPRPERPFFVEQFQSEMPEYVQRHSMRPGITGLAQIAGKYSTSAEDKLRYDLLYIKGASHLADLKIILQTLKVILMRGKAS